MQEADLLSNVVRVADSVLLAALAAQVAAPALALALSTVSHSCDRALIASVAAPASMSGLQTFWVSV